MSDLQPILEGMRREMETMNKSFAQICKTHAQVLSEEWITKDQAMATLKISARTLENLKKNGLLPFSKVNGLIYFKTIDIENLLNKHYSQPTSTENHNQKPI